MTKFIRKHRLELLLAFFHILVVAASNYTVQFPVSVFGFKTTWGAFVFPFIFLATDLTVRVLGAKSGRKVILFAMLPALIISYIVTSGFRMGVWQGVESLFTFNLFVFRIAFASFAAYVTGQILDVFVFSRLRRHKQWWHAPVASGIFGNFTDTATFFFIAFYKTSDSYLAENLVEIASVDYVFKLLISGLFFLPLYKIILHKISSRMKTEWFGD